MFNSTVRSRPRGAVLAAACAAVGVALGGLGLGGLGQAAAGTSAGPAAKDDPAEWTMMVYAVGDTPSVPQLMVENLAELTQLPPATDVNVVVLLDLPDAGDDDAPLQALPGVGDFSTAKLLVLEDGRFTEVRDLGEVSMGQPDTLASFVEEAADRFPARHYGFTFFDHGGGNTGGYVDTGPPVGQSLSVPEMREGLVDGMHAAGIEKFDVINHAACLMANYETASALAPLTDWIAASEEIMIYPPLAVSTFEPLARGGSGEEVANAFVQGYTDLLDEIAEQPGGQAYRELLAMSVVDGGAVSGLDRAMESFSQAAIAHLPEITTEVAKARADALEYVAGFPGTEGESYDLIDLGDFMRHLTNVPDDVAVARDAVSAALDRAVTLQSTGKGTQQATGMNVYLPANPRNVNQEVLSDGTEPAGWGEFVQAFVDSASGSDDGGGGVRFVSRQAQILQADASGIKIAGTLVGGSSENLTRAETYVLAQLGGQQALAVIFPAYVDAGGPGQVQGVWDYGVTALSDGRTSVPATTQYQAQSGGLLGTFLAHYVAPDGAESDIGVRVLLSSTGDIESVTTFDVTTGSSAGVSLQVGGTLTPYVFVPSSNGYQRRPSERSIRITDQLQVDFVRLPAGKQFDMAVVVGDAAGNTDATSVSGRVQ